jgi:hypothetical protein
VEAGTAEDEVVTSAEEHPKSAKSRETPSIRGARVAFERAKTTSAEEGAHGGRDAHEPARATGPRARTRPLDERELTSVRRTDEAFSAGLRGRASTVREREEPRRRSRRSKGTWRSLGRTITLDAFFSHPKCGERPHAEGVEALSSSYRDRRAVPSGGLSPSFCPRTRRCGRSSRGSRGEARRRRP